MKKLVAVLIVALCSLLVFPALASASTPTLKSLARSLAALQKKVNAQSTSISALKTDLATAKLTIGAQGTTIQTLQATVSDQAATLSAAAPLLAIAPYVSLHSDSMDGVAGPNVVFQGCNVHVRSTVSESDVSGLGNLIVGWDGLPGIVPSPFRSGSNNLVLGTGNNFTSFGGLVSGLGNTVAGQNAAVLAGDANTATGHEACIVGGWGNTANGGQACVLGGRYNLANASGSSVSGGSYNIVSAVFASISGGGGSQASAGLSMGTPYGWAAGSSPTPGIPLFHAP